MSPILVTGATGNLGSAALTASPPLVCLRERPFAIRPIALPAPTPSSRAPRRSAGSFGAG